MTDLFADSSKFTKLKSDPTLSQHSSLQNYLRTIMNRCEISNNDEYTDMRPTSTKPSRAWTWPS